MTEVTGRLHDCIPLATHEWYAYCTEFYTRPAVASLDNDLSICYELAASAAQILYNLRYLVFVYSLKPSQH